MKYNCISGNGIEISVQHFPNRKLPCLCVERPAISGLQTLATFKSEKHAELFMTMLCNMTGTYIPNELFYEVVE